MGSSKSKEPEKFRKRGVNDDEFEMLQNTFKNFVKPKGKPGSDVIEEAKLREFFNNVLSANITCRLCELLAFASHKISSDDGINSCKSPGLITFSGMVAFVGEFLNGGETAHCEILTKLAANQTDTVTAKEMHQFLSDIIQSYFIVIKRTKIYQSWEAGVAKMDSSKLAQSLLIELFYKGKDPNDCLTLEAIPDLSFNENDIENWHRCTPIGSRIISMVFRSAFALENKDVLDKDGERHRQLLPLCCGVSWQKTHSMLSFTEIIFLNQCLPTALNDQWRYVFSTKQYGESFSQLLGKILNKGPTILVIRDKMGGVFGGYASDSWKLQPQFNGNESCFLFTLHPRMGMYPSTGYNDHFMYLNINQQTMPNGLGMGGQLEYFGLWLDRDFGHGRCSKTCTTYQSPQLSSSLDFTLDTVEVWAVGPEPRAQEEGTRSALDTIDPELKAILEMANRAPISDAIREADKKKTERENHPDV